MEMAPPPLLTSTDPDASPSITDPSRLINLRNPLPLSAAQEAEVRGIYHKNVRLKCAPEIKSFAECARGRTVTAMWLCREQRLAMNGCMIQHAVREEEDKAREEWFRTVEDRREEKQKKHVETERRREEVIRMTRERERKEREEEEQKRRVSTVKEQGGVGSKGWWK